MKLLSFSLILLTSTLFLSSTMALSITPKDCRSFDVGQRPESITRAFGGDLFVSVMGGTQPNDGVIVRISNGEVSTFATGFNEPKGLAYVNSTLFVSDLDRVLAIDSQGQTTTIAGPNNFPFPVSYLNDVAADPFQTGIYVVDMGDRSNMWKSENPREFWPIDSAQAQAFQVIGRVYHISLDGRVSCVVDADPRMICPNGVTLENSGEMIITAFFNGYLLRYANGEFEILSENMRGADGVEQHRNGDYYVSSWNQGKVWKINENGDRSVFAEGFSSAADFYLDDRNNLLFLPDMLEGKIYQLVVE